jgi:hypothetical protein
MSRANRAGGVDQAASMKFCCKPQYHQKQIKEYKIK